MTQTGANSDVGAHQELEDPAVASAPEPRRLVRDVLLRDGSTLASSFGPRDFEDIEAFYDGLSSESRYLRFHGFARTDIVARAEADASGVDRLALLARHDGRVVATAGYEGLWEPGVAEVAFAVADELHRHGIGTRMLEQLAAIAAERGIHRLVGPHSLGVVNTDPEIRLNATFSGASASPGALGICSQSAAPGIGLLGHAAARRLGVSMLVSLGDRADVSTNDLLEYFEEDERTAAVMLYVETFGSPEHFTRIAQRVSRKKPILALKGRRYVESARTEVRSDTAAALRSDTVVDALLRQAGVLRLRSGEELFDAAEFFGCQPLPSGRQIGIITNSAGLATLATTPARRAGLSSRSVRRRRTPSCSRSARELRSTPPASQSCSPIPGIDALLVCYVDLSGGPTACSLRPRPRPRDSPSRWWHRSSARTVNFPRVSARVRLPLPVPSPRAQRHAAERRESLSHPLRRRRAATWNPPDTASWPRRDRRRRAAGLPSRSRQLQAAHGIPIAASHHCRELRAVELVVGLGDPRSEGGRPRRFTPGHQHMLLGLRGKRPSDPPEQELHQRVGGRTGVDGR